MSVASLNKIAPKSTAMMELLSRSSLLVLQERRVTAAADLRGRDTLRRSCKSTHDVAYFTRFTVTTEISMRAENNAEHDIPTGTHG